MPVGGDTANRVPVPDAGVQQSATASRAQPTLRSWAPVHRPAERRGPGWAASCVRWKRAHKPAASVQLLRTSAGVTPTQSAQHQRSDFRISQEHTAPTQKAWERQTWLRRVWDMFCCCAAATAAAAEYWSLDICEEPLPCSVRWLELVSHATTNSSRPGNRCIHTCCNCCSKAAAECVFMGAAPPRYMSCAGVRCMDGTLRPCCWCRCVCAAWDACAMLAWNHSTVASCCA